MFRKFRNKQMGRSDGDSLFGILFIIGWVANVIQAIGGAGAPITGLWVIKCICIFIPPVGAIWGWVDIFH